MEGLESIEELLKENNLPYEDIASSKVEFITSKSEGRLLGCIGIEKYLENGLLRSFAVTDDHKNRGIGSKLLDALLDHCKNTGVKELHLLTTTASTYFSKKGFVTANRKQAPPSISSTMEFSEICPSSSVYMVKKIN